MPRYKRKDNARNLEKVISHQKNSPQRNVEIVKQFGNLSEVWLAWKLSAESTKVDGAPIYSNNFFGFSPFCCFYQFFFYTILFRFGGNWQKSKCFLPFFWIVLPFFCWISVRRAIDFQLNIQRCSKASTSQNIWINCQRAWVWQ